jgi:hypothetical protein
VINLDSKNREEIIREMCLTHRPDYDLDKLPGDPPWIAGMTPAERTGLYRTMSQLYDENIAPLLEAAKKPRKKNDRNSKRRR